MRRCAFRVRATDPGLRPLPLRDVSACAWRRLRDLDPCRACGFSDAFRERGAGGLPVLGAWRAFLLWNLWQHTLLWVGTRTGYDRHRARESGRRDRSGSRGAHLFQRSGKLGRARGRAPTVRGPKRDRTPRVGAGVSGGVRLRSLLLAGLALFGCWDGSGSTPVVLVTIDTLRADHLSAYGYFRNTSPVLDALAEEGVLFENASTVMATTLPAHTSLFTSTYTPRHLSLIHI